MQAEYSDARILNVTSVLQPRSNDRSRASAALAILMAMVCAASTLGGAGRASAQSYNPGDLPSDQFGRVANICQSTLGLRPSEPPRPVWGAATNPDLSGGETDYQGCVTSLSASQRAVNHGAAAGAADRDCRAQGYASATPGLAECVLRTQRAAQVADGSPGTVPVSESVSPGSYYSASHGEQARRIESACAQLGLNPAYSAFSSCVKSMKDTFYSIDNPRG